MADPAARIMDTPLGLSRIPFTKMSGAGNTFVLIDDRQGIVETALKGAGLTPEGFAQGICSADRGAGADGLILIEPSRAHDFAWRFFNADGSRADMCGNGARCAARFAQEIGAAKGSSAFETGAGVVRAERAGDAIRVTLTPPGPVGPELSFALGAKAYAGRFIDTGVPHVVFRAASVADLDLPDFATLGPAVRYDPRFAPAGTNVDFVATGADGTLQVRTWERGVERETLACGTGIAAAALVTAALEGRESPVTVVPRSGEPLTVGFVRRGGGFRDVTLEGPARVLFTGELDPEALRRPGEAPAPRR
jgi:diaminopimelate epimerase